MGTDKTVSEEPKLLPFSHICGARTKSGGVCFRVLPRKYIHCRWHKDQCSPEETAAYEVAYRRSRIRDLKRRLAQAREDIELAPTIKAEVVAQHGEFAYENSLRNLVRKIRWLEKTLATLQAED